MQNLSGKDATVTGAGQGIDARSGTGRPELTGPCDAVSGEGGSAGG